MKKYFLVSLLFCAPLMADVSPQAPVTTIADVVSHPDMTKLVNKQIKKKKEGIWPRIGISAGTSALTSVVVTVVVNKFFNLN